MNTRYSPLALAGLLWAAALLSSAPALAQTSPVARMDTADLIAALGGNSAANTGVVSKAFRRTAPPDASHACPEVMDTGSGGNSGKGVSSKLVVVEAPYQPDTQYSVQMDIQFAYNADAIQPDSRRLLDNLANALNSPNLASAHFALAGHTDTSGQYDRNLELSCARAIAVRSYLMQRGVSGQRLGAYGFGPDKLLDRNAPYSASNRRVEIRRAD